MTTTWVTAAVVMVIVVLTGIVVYASACIQSGIFVDAQCHIAPSEGILLTFDDGPDPTETPQVLDVLDRHGHKAIFFLIGQKAEEHPQLVREIIRRGHQIGNHTYHHSPYANLRGATVIRREIEMCSEAICTACGKRPTLFRPPLGISTHFMRQLMQQMGLSVVGWSVRSFDTRGEERAKVLARVAKQMRPGSIILLHDRLPGAHQLADDILSLYEKRTYGQ